MGGEPFARAKLGSGSRPSGREARPARGRRPAEDGRCVHAKACRQPWQSFNEAGRPQPESCHADRRAVTGGGQYHWFASPKYGYSLCRSARRRRRRDRRSPSWRARRRTASGVRMIARPISIAVRPSARPARSTTSSRAVQRRPRWWLIVKPYPSTMAPVHMKHALHRSPCLERRCGSSRGLTLCVATPPHCTHASDAPHCTHAGAAGASASGQRRPHAGHCAQTSSGGCTSGSRASGMRKAAYHARRRRRRRRGTDSPSAISRCNTAS